MRGPTRHDADDYRGRVAWHMPLALVVLGHSIGFDYPINGDTRPRRTH